MIAQMDLNYWEGIMNGGGDSDSEGAVVGTEEEEEEENSDAEPDEDDEELESDACEELVQRVESTFLDILDGMIEEIEDEYDAIGPIPDVSKVQTPTKTAIITTTTTTTVSKESNKSKARITTQPPLSSPSAAVARNDLQTLNDSRDEGTQTEEYTLDKSGEGEDEYGIKLEDDDMMKSTRSEIASLRLAKETLVNQRKEISDRLKRGLSESEELDEKRVYEFEEAIEAIDSAIEYKNEFLCGRDITLSNCLAPGKNKANLATRLTNLSKLDLQRLVWKYLSKVVELRYSSKRLEKQVGQQETDYENMSVLLTRSRKHQHEMQAEYESRIKLITSAVSKNPSANHLNQDLKLLNKQLTHALKKQYDLERSLTELLVRHGYLLNGTDYDVKQVVRMLGIDTEKVGLNWRPGDDEDEEEDKRMSSRAGYNNNTHHNIHREKSKTRDRRDSIPLTPALPTQGGGIPPEIRSALESGLGTSRRMREREAYNQNHHYYYDEDQDLPSSQFHLQPYQSNRSSSRHRRHHHRHHQPSSQSRYRSSGHHYYESSHHDNNYGGNERHLSHHHASSSPQPPPTAAEVRREKQKLIIQPRNRDF